jgi:cytochrome c553
MTSRHLLPATFGLAALAAVALPAAAADIDAGRKAAAPCAACHGNDGKSPTDPNAPKLAGQYADYLRKALRDYQTGARKNAVMAGLAKPLSKQDIENLAAYYESLPGPLSHRR